MKKYYKPSGKFSLTSLLLLASIGIIIFPLLGLLYAYAIWYIPFIYINFLIAAALGFAIGFVVDKTVIRFGKVRNSKLGSFLGILAGLITLYFHWSVWVDLVINAGQQYGSSQIGVTVSNIQVLQVFTLASNPTLLFELIGQINQTGTWGFKSIPVSGFFLSIIWVIEALIIIIIPTFMAWIASKKPFCETNNAWFKEEILSPFDFITDKQKVVTGIINDDRNVFDNLNKNTNSNNNHSIFTLYSSENTEYYLTINNKIAKINEKQEVSFDDDEFVEYISISSFLVTRLRSI